MKSLIAAVVAAVSALAISPAMAAGDPLAGAAKAQSCAACHGDKKFPGMFFTLQLAGRSADKLVAKTNQYRSFKIINPIMNVPMAGLTDKDVEDIAAYYHSLGKPAFVNPMFPIKGDDEDAAAPRAAAPAPVKTVYAR